MKTQKNIFKHTDVWYLLPLPKVIIEPFARETAITLEVTFLQFTAYVTFWVNKKLK